VVRVVTVKDIKKLLEKVTLKTFFLKLIDQLESDYGRWEEFQKAPRYAIYYSNGVIELMPISDQEYCAFKYVNGHPGNPMQKKQTVIAIGQLSLVENGYPVLISEMTVLTAIRTAATSALVSKYMARKNAKTFGIIGCGAQSEFQVLAHHFALGVREIYYFDTDAKAMEKFQENLKPFKLELHPCKDGKTVVEKSDIVTTATAQYGHHKIVRAEWVKKGCHLNKIGGDSPGKTELDPALLSKSKIVVELLDQTQCEGEIQQNKESKVHAEIWEIVSGKKKGRESDSEITLFDSVGFALEDYSALRFVYALSEEHGIGHELDMVPDTPNPKNLFGVLSGL
jgi:ornithine cyclodeaminase